MLLYYTKTFITLLLMIFMFLILRLRHTSPHTIRCLQQLGSDELVDDGLDSVDDLLLHPPPTLLHGRNSPRDKRTKKVEICDETGILVLDTVDVVREEGEEGEEEDGVEVEDGEYRVDDYDVGRKEAGRKEAIQENILEAIQENILEADIERKECLPDYSSQTPFVAELAPVNNKQKAKGDSGVKKSVAAKKIMPWERVGTQPPVDKPRKTNSPINQPRKGNSPADKLRRTDSPIFHRLSPSEPSPEVIFVEGKVEEKVKSKGIRRREGDGGKIYYKVSKR